MSEFESENDKGENKRYDGKRHGPSKQILANIKRLAAIVCALNHDDKTKYGQQEDVIAVFHLCKRTREGI